MLTIHESTCNQLPENCKCCIKIEHVTKIRYLGINIDQRLKWDLQIDLMINRLKKLIYIFLTVREFLPLNSLKMIYYALAESIIQYGIICWGGSFKNVLNRLQIMQKTLIKILIKKPRLYSSQALFEETELLSINKLYIRAILLFYYRNPHEIKTITHGYRTRSLTNCHASYPKVNTTIYSNFILSKIKILNNLPNEYKQINNIKLFRKKVNRYIKEMEELVL